MRPSFSLVTMAPTALILASAPAAAQAAGIGDIVTHTPIWVWAIFLYVMTMTYRATRERTAGLVRLLAIPVLFVLLGLSGLLNRQSFGLGLALDWAAFAGIGAVLASLVGKPVLLAVDRERNQVTLAGSWAPLVRVSFIFVAKYALGATMAVRPDLRDSLSWADAAVSGFSAGYFLLWGVRLYVGFLGFSAESRQAA